MALEVHVFSKELIKPAFPTPQHLQKYQLSFLDQTAPEVFMPLILYYSPDDVRRMENSTTTASNHLKKSLSETLTRFYPLAGRRINNSHVNCNDEGVHLVESRVNIPVSDVIRNPIPNELTKLLPLELDHVTDLNLAIQLSTFACGGIAVAVTISHKLADALTLFTFLKTWAAIARGDDTVPAPVFGSATLFPPLDVSGFPGRTGIVKEKIVCKRFVFSAAKIASLRNMYAANGSNDADDEYSYRPTRVEALSTFIWNRHKAVTQKPKEDDDKILYTIFHPVNLRKKFDPPLPDNYFGNLYKVAVTVPSMTENEETNKFELVQQMRAAIKSIDMGYVEKLRKAEDDHLKFVMEMCMKFSMGKVVSFSFTSLCRFGLYEADFGWGKPVWIGSTALTFQYLVSFFDTKTGDGIEAWVNLKEEDMAKFEADEELLEFTEDPCAQTPTTEAVSLKEEDMIKFI